MILYRIFYKKHEVSYFMKFLIFLSMIITSSAKVHLSKKNPLQNNYNETLSDQDFEDSDILAENNYISPHLLDQSQASDNDLKLQSSTNGAINSLKKNKALLSKKHRNIIKMVCDSDNLISQMTLHMNFLDGSKDDKQHEYTFKKIFNSDDPKNDISFSYPEAPETLLESRSEEPGERLIKDFELSVSKPYIENESLKKENNINYLLLNEEYENYPVSKKKKIKPQTYTKEDYKAEIKKFNSGPRIESLKSNKESYSPSHVKEKKRNKKVKFWVTAMSVPDTLQSSEEVEKDNVLHKLHLSQSSDHSEQLPLKSNNYNNTSEPEEMNFESNIDSSDIVIPQVVDNIEQAQNNTQNEQDNSFNDKEYDGENKNNEEVLNYSRKFKKYKLENSKNAIDDIENANQPDDTFLYDYPVSYKKQYRNKMLKKDPELLNREKTQKKYKTLKSNLVAQPKMKSAIFSNRNHVLAEKKSGDNNNKKKKILQRQKVIENLKFILSKQSSEHPKTEGKLRSKYFTIEKTKDAPKISNISRRFEKKNSTTAIDISDNGTENVLFKNEDKETESSSTVEEILLEYQNETPQFGIYDIDLNDNDIKKKLKNKDLLNLENEGKKKSVDQQDLNSKSDILYKKDTEKQLSQEPRTREKYLVKRMADDKGEEIRKGVFLKKGIPLQFNPYQKINDLNNIPILGLQTLSPVGNSQRNLKSLNEKQNSDAKNSFKFEELKNFLSNSENLKINVKRNAMSDNTYVKACSRFLRDIALIKFLDEKYNEEPIFFSN